MAKNDEELLKELEKKLEAYEASVKQFSHEAAKFEYPSDDKKTGSLRSKKRDSMDPEVRSVLELYKEFKSQHPEKDKSDKSNVVRIQKPNKSTPKDDDNKPKGPSNH